MKRSFERFSDRLKANGLYTGANKICSENYVSLCVVYDGGKAPSVVAARRAVYVWMSGRGMGNNQIARMFDRAKSGVSKSLKGTSQ